MKDVKQLLKQISDSGLIYDPFITATIINYEAGHVVRNCFYATLSDPSKGETEVQYKAGYLANARVELSDLITQARILAEVYGWDWQELIDTGEAKLTERIHDYELRGIRPNLTLMDALSKNLNTPRDSAKLVERPKPRERLSGD